VPGSTMEVRDVNMDFSYGHSFTESSPEAYERLILDVLLGEPSLFPNSDEVELSWEILEPVIDQWAKRGKPAPYPAGTWGPDSATEMLARTGRKWRRP
jgi:glucose-6-phosphate 1-dehydrogenase